MVIHKNRIEQSDLLQVAFKNDKTRSIQESVKAKNQKVYMAMLMGNRNSDNVRILFNTEEKLNHLLFPHYKIKSCGSGSSGCCSY